MATDQPPTRADLLDWLGLTEPGTSPDDYDLALAVAMEQQAARCTWDTGESPERPYTAGLHHAALRRAAKMLAAKGMSLGVFDSGDYGTQFQPRWDQQIEDSEMDHRTGGFA